MACYKDATKLCSQDVTTQHSLEVPKQYTVNVLGTLQLNITKGTNSDIEKHNVMLVRCLSNVTSLCWHVDEKRTSLQCFVMFGLAGNGPTK